MALHRVNAREIIVTIAAEEEHICRVFFATERMSLDYAYTLVGIFVAVTARQPFCTG